MKFTTSYTTMNLFAFFLTIFTLLGSFVVQAAPIEQRDVYVPKILTPQDGDTWTVGEEVTVTWDTSNPPTQITNKIGRIVLRKGNLATPLVLAGNFDILNGKATFRVPTVVQGSDYSIVLFGDSGNWSGQFTINSPFKN
ncbi:hypothetical protein D9756_002184 [Leucocoprinus leucothites]|uniref:Yeast cell wall synthesis Kre9/Knh1-like N-terminal domain-containing protein n=1 Tax=Leucocoprinus leucothites TaxID=201217 RepID=A0A8H5GCD6_9AGAR|nr:hypothetical protein D9756_002184 [Leucoagaricus leucothites]